MFKDGEYMFKSGEFYVFIKDGVPYFSGRAPLTMRLSDFFEPSNWQEVKKDEN